MSMSENYNEGQVFEMKDATPTCIKVFPWGSLTIGQIAGALAKAQGAMHNPTKAKKVEQKRWSKAENKYVDASYMYASLNEIQNAARQALAENGVSVFQPVSGDISRIEITTVLMHCSGEWMATEPLFTTPVGIGDRGPSVQDMGSLITYLRRYSLCSALNLSAAEDDTDGKTDEEDDQKPAPRARGQQPADRGHDAGKPAPAPAAPPANKPKNYDKPPERPAVPAAQPPKEAPKPEEPATEDGSDMENAKTEFAEALAYWLKNGWNKAGLLDIRKKLTAACAISSEDDAQWIVDDYYTYMARMDLETAQKEWAAKGLTADGLQEFVNGLHEAGELNSKVIDQLNADSYNHLMDVVDADLGISRE